MTRVLHVLPHAGGGAQTYVDTIASLDGYRFGIFELSSTRSAAAAARSIAVRRLALMRAAQAADLIHVHGEVASLLTLGLLARRRSVVTLHGLHLWRRLAEGAPKRVGALGLRAIIGAAGATICVSQAERDELAWLPGRLLAKLAVVRNGMAAPPEPDPARRVRTRAALGLGDDAVAVLYTGQLEARKDPLTVLRAARRAHEHDPRVTLLVAGSGPEDAALRAASGPETRLLGYRSDVAELLEAADVFVMPSRREGLCYAVLEAMGHGVATVVSDGPGNPEAVGEAGLVFPAGDDARLAELLRELAGDPSRRAALGRAGRARIVGELSAEAMLRGTAAVYEAVLTEPGRRGGARRA